MHKMWHVYSAAFVLNKSPRRTWYVSTVFHLFPCWLFSAFCSDVLLLLNTNSSDFSTFIKLNPLFQKYNSQWGCYTVPVDNLQWTEHGTWSQKRYLSVQTIIQKIYVWIWNRWYRLRINTIKIIGLQPPRPQNVHNINIFARSIVCWNITGTINYEGKKHSFCLKTVKVTSCVCVCGGEADCSVRGSKTKVTKQFYE